MSLLRSAQPRLARLIANCIALSAMSAVTPHPDVVRGKVVPAETLGASCSISDWSAIQFGYCGYQRHAFALDEFVKSFVVQISASGELDQWQPFAAIGHQQVIPTCVRLASPGGPSAVPWFVISVGVDPVKRVSVGPWTHVVSERREVIQPFGAHLNPASAPVVEATGVGVVAPFLCVSPRPVFGRHDFGFSSSYQGAVLQAVLPLDLTKEATATLSATIPQGVTKHHAFLPAVTTAQPFWVTPRAQVARQRNQPSKSNPGQIIKFHSDILPHKVIP